jgi:hypothetical protein
MHLEKIGGALRSPGLQAVDGIEPEPEYVNKVN